MSGLNGYPHRDGEAWGKPLPSAGGSGGGGRTPGCIHLVLATVAVVAVVVGWLS